MKLTSIFVGLFFFLLSFIVPNTTSLEHPVADEKPLPIKELPPGVNGRNTESPPPQQQQQQSNWTAEDTELKMEANFISFENDQLHITYSNKTRENFYKILGNRIILLSHKYCGSLPTDLRYFAEDHAEGLGVTSKTVPGFDAFDVAQRLLLMLDNLKEDHIAFPKFNASIHMCRESTETKKSGIPKREEAFWLLGCVANVKRKEMMQRHPTEAILSWTVSVEADAALEALGELLQCRHHMLQLALYQLDIEYKKDGMMKGYEAGKISKDKLDLVLARSKVPSRGDYQRFIISKRLEDIKKVLEEEEGQQGPMEDKGRPEELEEL